MAKNCELVVLFGLIGYFIALYCFDKLSKCNKPWKQIGSTIYFILALPIFALIIVFLPLHCLKQLCCGKSENQEDTPKRRRKLHSLYRRDWAREDLESMREDKCGIVLTQYHHGKKLG